MKRFLGILLALVMVFLLMAASTTVRAASIFTVININDSGSGSLRQAILDANDSPGTDTITFNIPGAGPHTIQPKSALPWITDSVIIDGYTQPGASPNTNPPATGLNTVLMIELDCSNIGSDVTGLHFVAGSSIVRGLVINRFSRHGILLDIRGNNVVEGNLIGTDITGTTTLNRSGLQYNRAGVKINDTPGNTIGGTTAEACNIISGNIRLGVWITGRGATGNLVQGNFIGTDVTGTAALGNTDDGVWIYASSGNVIGGTTVEARNIISGNHGLGVKITIGGNLVQGNFIGTDVTGTTDLGNGGHGVCLGARGNNTIGGTTEGARNVISGNHYSGVSIDGMAASGNLVQGNYIGTDVTGTGALGNSGHGVDVNGGAHDNTIGGTAAGAGNLISGNSNYGVNLYGSFSHVTGNLVQGNTITSNMAGGVLVDERPGGWAANNAILSNSIFSNAGLGIDLGGDGVTPNDSGDGDPGANNLQNFPILTLATNDSITTIEGTLNTMTDTQFRLEIFSNSSCDPSGYGEGETFLGFTNVTTSGSGDVTFTVTFPDTVPSGHSITATATDPNNNTSEFSQCVEVTAGNGGVPNGDDGDGGVTVGGAVAQVDKFGLMMPWIIVTALVLLAITSLALWMKKNKMG